MPIQTHAQKIKATATRIEDSRSPPHANRDNSPDWDLDSQGNLPNITGTQSPSPVPSATHSPTPNFEPGDDPESGSESLQEYSQASRNARRPRWLPWQDRYLALTVEKIRPFEAGRGDLTRETWGRVSVEILEWSRTNDSAEVNRTGEACRGHFEMLLRKHKV